MKLMKWNYCCKSGNFIIIDLSSLKLFARQKKNVDCPQDVGNLEKRAKLMLIDDAVEQQRRTEKGESIIEFDRRKLKHFFQFIRSESKSLKVGWRL